MIFKIKKDVCQLLNILSIPMIILKSKKTNKRVQYVIFIDRSKEIHLAINNPKERTKDEESVYKFARGSIVADKNLKKDQIIKSEDIWARRPGNGEIPADKFDHLVGKRIKHEIKYNTQRHGKMFHPNRFLTIKLV